MSRNILLLFARWPAIVCAVLPLSLPLTSMRALAGEKGWVLTQRSQTLGDQYVYMSPSGLKCINPKEGIGLIARAPNWDVVLFNDKNKLYYQTTVDKWKRDLAARGIHREDISMSGWVRRQTKSIAGLKATEYVSKADDAALKRMMAKRGKRTGNIKSAEYWVSEDIVVPSKLANMLQTAYGLPSSHGIPLRLSYANQDGNPQLLLDTYRAQRTPIPTNYFDLGAGYKLAKTDTEVIINEETKQIINDLANELGGDSQQTTVNPSTSGPSRITPSGKTATLPGGFKVSKDDIDKFLEMYKQHKNK